MKKVEPFEVSVPNKIRKRIAMHKRRALEHYKNPFVKTRYLLPPSACSKKRGLCSRSIGKVEKVRQELEKL